MICLFYKNELLIVKLTLFMVLYFDNFNTEVTKSQEKLQEVNTDDKGI